MEKAYQKLQLIQAGLRAPKGQFNNFGNFAYRSCEDILEALKPHLHEQKALIILQDKIVEICGSTYVEATAKLIDAETGQSIEATAYAREPESKKGMDSAQITGATSSYARKYALNGLFAIDDSKDADSNEVQRATQEKEPLPKSNDSDLDQVRKEILGVLEAKNISVDRFVRFCDEKYKSHDFDKLGIGAARNALEEVKGW